MSLYIIYAHYINSGNFYRLGQYVDSKATRFLQSDFICLLYLDDFWQGYMVCNWCQKQRPYILPIELLISILEYHIIY